MTSQSEADKDAAIAFYASIYPDIYCAVAVTSFVLYDWVLTLPRELQLFWTGKARFLSATLYFATKYVNLLALIIGLFYFAPMSDSGCNTVVLANNVFGYLTFLPPAVFAGLRVFALTHRHWLAILTFLLSSTQFIVDMITFRFNPIGAHFPLLGCLENHHLPYSFHQISFITARIATIVADTLLVAITWKFLPGGMRIKGLARIMLCDGILYFVVLSLVNILHLILTELSTASDGATSLVSVFPGPLSAVLISHFLLDLQETHQKHGVGLTVDGPSEHTSQSHSYRSIDFAPALGSLAATIDPADYYGLDSDEHDSDETAWTYSLATLEGATLRQNSGGVP